MITCYSILYLTGILIPFYFPFQRDHLRHILGLPYTMTPEELQALPTVLAGDFRSIEPHLRSLDKHLTLRTYIEGYKLGELETKIWQTLKTNKASVGILRKGSLVNLTRWCAKLT